MKFGTGIDLGNILEEFEGHGLRSKVKVIRLKNIFRVFAWTYCLIFDISAYKGFMCIQAQNFVHAHANFTHAHA